MLWISQAKSRKNFLPPPPPQSETHSYGLDFIVSYSPICCCLQADMFYNFLHFLCFDHCIYLYKCGLGKVLRIVIKSCLL